MCDKISRTKKIKASINTNVKVPESVVHLEFEAVVDEVIHPGREWRIRYQSIFWRARAATSGCNFKPGDVVYVVGRQGLVLLVQPASAMCN
ncbi:MAG: NfeD family protein [Bacteroidota bacterium]